LTYAAHPAVYTSNSIVHAAAPALTYSSVHAPALAYSSVHAPALTYSAVHAPALTYSAVHAPAVTYAAAPTVVAAGQPLREATLTKVVNTPGKKGFTC
jgi:hypothetical protein